MTGNTKFWFLEHKQVLKIESEAKTIEFRKFDSFSKYWMKTIDVKIDSFWKGTEKPSKISFDSFWN